MQTWRVFAEPATNLTRFSSTFKSMCVVCLESSLTFESLSTTSRKGNIGLDRETPEYKELRKLRRDGIRQTIAKMERAQQVTDSAYVHNHTVTIPYGYILR